MLKNRRRTPLSSKSGSGAIYSKTRPHFRMKRRYIAGNLLSIFITERDSAVQNWNDAPRRKQERFKTPLAKMIVSTLWEEHAGFGSTPGVKYVKARENIISDKCFGFQKPSVRGGPTTNCIDPFPEVMYPSLTNNLLLYSTHARSPNINVTGNVRLAPKQAAITTFGRQQSYLYFNSFRLNLLSTLWNTSSFCRVLLFVHRCYSTVTHLLIVCYRY